ncbi:Chloroperoxidase [Gautieria morchelliformis]|nr:Chloroperoxidase [Gautieria morchelliformis]
MSTSSSDTPDHTFQPPEATASRSPCPALNAAASHGYLYGAVGAHAAHFIREPRSGRDITFMQLLNAVRTVYNLSFPFAFLLASGGFFLCGRNGRPTIPFFGTIDLHDLARHGRIEHDGSLAHADAEPHAEFAPTTPDQTLLKDMLDEAKGAYLTMEDLVRVRSKRDALLANEGRSLEGKHAEISRGEISLLLAIIGDGQKVSSEWLKQWMGEERLPDGWTRPQVTRGLIASRGLTKRITEALKQMNASREAEQVHNHGDESIKQD